MVMGMIVWEGVSRPMADRAYETLKTKMANCGIPMEVNIRRFFLLNQFSYEHYSFCALFYLNIL